MCHRLVKKIKEKQMVCNWTKEQSVAINDRGRNVLVSASDGSGKTTVMIERIVNLILQDKTPISRFLVVTFTKASANDMKSKLVEKLMSYQDDAFALSQIEEIATSDISNLHSFCSRLISTYFYETGVDPSYHIIDETEGTGLMDKALTMLFERKQSAGDEAFFRLFDIFQKKRQDKSLKEIIKKFHSFLNTTIDGAKWFNETIKESYNTNLNKNVCANMINTYVCNSMAKDSIVIENFAKRCLDFGQEKMYQHFIDISSLFNAVKKSKSYVTNSKIVHEIVFDRTPTPAKEVKFLAEEAKALKKRLRDNLDNYKANYVSDSEEELVQGLSSAREIIVSLYELTLQFNQIYCALKKDVNGLDFNDLEKYTLEILSNDDILAQIRNKYKYVFVDEYQDINSVQEKIISLIASENNRFMVGDVKQSIYRFRLCAPDIFLQKYSTYENDSEKNVLVKLNCNFRSDKKILKFVDEVFSGVMTKDFGDLDYEADSKFVPGENNLDQEKSVNLCLIDTHKEKSSLPIAEGVYSVADHEQNIDEEMEKAVSEAIYVADKISELVDRFGQYRYEYKDIAILVGSRNQAVTKFIETLRALGIRVSSDEKYDLMQRVYIEELLSFVKILCNEKNDFELFKVLKSKLFGFSDAELVQIRLVDKKMKFHELFNFANGIEDECLKTKVENFLEKVEKYRKISKIVSLKELLKIIIQDFSIFQINLTEPEGNNYNLEIDRFIEMLPDVSPIEFVINYADQTIQYENECGGDAVKVMTIHKSKGMEFKAVFLINTTNGFNFKSTYGGILFNKQFGVGLDYFDVVSRTQMSTIPISAIRILEKIKLVEEQQRVLYVALTRAKQKLYVVCSKDKDKVKEYFPDRPMCYADWFDRIIAKELAGKHNEILNFEEIDAFSLVSNEKIKNKQIIFAKENSENVNWFEYNQIESTKVPLKNSISKIVAENLDNYEEIVFEQSEINSSADRGTAYHKVLQMIDIKNLQNIAEQLCKIKDQVDFELWKLIDEKVVATTLQLPIFSDIAKSDVILQEREFFAKMPAKLINENATDKDCFIMQGVVDLIAVFENEIWVLDYKTGQVNENKLEKYKLQIDTYASVCERAFGKRVSKRLICFIDSQKILEI